MGAPGLSFETDEALLLTYYNHPDIERARAALNELLHRRWDLLHAVAKSAIPNGVRHGDHDDIASEACLLVIHSINDGRDLLATQWQPVPGGSVAGWIVNKVRWNVWTVLGAKYRIRSGDRVRVHADVLDELPDPADIEGRAVLRLTVLESLDQLPPDRGWLLFEHYVKGRSQASLAKELGLSTTIVNRRIKRSLAVLRDRLCDLAAD